MFCDRFVKIHILCPFPIDHADLVSLLTVCRTEICLPQSSEPNRIHGAPKGLFILVKLKHPNAEEPGKVYGQRLCPVDQFFDDCGSGLLSVLPSV